MKKKFSDKKFYSSINTSGPYRVAQLMAWTIQALSNLQGVLKCRSSSPSVSVRRSPLYTWEFTKKTRTVRKLSTLHCQSSATQLENLLQKTALSDPMKLIDHPEGRTGA